jgi:predicted RNA polymerase sigma factor
LVPLADQDRTLWDRTAIAEGLGLISRALAAGTVGPYQLQAAIAAVHAEAPSTADTDWREIVVLYELLERMSASPVFALNRAVAVAMLHGPAAGLEVLSTVERDTRLDGHHRVVAVRAHLLEMAGDAAGAAAAYDLAARLSTSLPERDYLRRRGDAVRTNRP